MKSQTKTLFLAVILLCLLVLSSCQTAPPAGVEESVNGYLGALTSGDYEAASLYVSMYSLDFSKGTREDVASYFQFGEAQGFKVVGYSIKNIRLLKDGNAVAVVNLETTTSGGVNQQSDVYLPFRQEDGTWRVNWQNLISYRNLEVPAQTINGVNVQPVLIVRFTDATRVYFNAENTSNERVLWGDVGQKIGVLSFGSKKVETFSDINQTTIAGPVVLEPDGKAEQVAVDFLGLSENEPISFALLGWSWPDRPTSSAQPAVKWNYSFDLK
jgi:hypothetical protein